MFAIIGKVNVDAGNSKTNLERFPKVKKTLLNSNVY